MDLEEFKKVATIFTEMCRDFNAETCASPVNLLFGTINRGKEYSPESFRATIVDFHQDAAGLGGLENFMFLIYCGLIRPAVHQRFNKTQTKRRVLPTKFRRTNY